MARNPAKQARNKIGNFNLVDKFLGYRARLDPTLEEHGVLVAPSQNVVLNTAGRVATVKGYVLDGAGSTSADSGILSSFDFANFKSDVRNMRAGFLTTAGNDGKLQYRYVVGTTVNWVDLKTALTNVRLCLCEYWDNVAFVKKVLWVDGTNNIFSWNGAVTTFASATATTLTKQGTNTWAQEGFAQTGTRSVVINGVTATYTGGETTTTLTGLSVDFSATAVASIIHQAPITTTLASMTGIVATFAPTVIGYSLDGRVYLGSSTSNNLYISKTFDYTNYAFTSPVRVAGEGNLMPLTSPPTLFIPMETRLDISVSDMWVSAGQNDWFIVRTTTTLSSDVLKAAEVQSLIRAKVGALQGAKSLRLATKMKNHITYLGNDKVTNFLGYLSYQNIPSSTDFSYPIIDDMNSYDFTDGSLFYYKNYIYLAVPKAGIVRAYNMTDQTQEQNSSLKGVEDVTQQPWFWESPITYPLSGFYTVNGDLYGHSYTTSESYKLFTGGSFNGQNIVSNATFSVDDLGDRTQSKASDSLWIEGYIKQNTTLNAMIAGDLGAFQTTQTVTVNGSDTNIVSYGAGGHAMGKNHLGSNPLGGAITSTSTLPAWFHVIKTYVNKPNYLEQVSFNTNGVDLQWELLSFGTNSTISAEGNNDITQ